MVFCSVSRCIIGEDIVEESCPVNQNQFFYALSVTKGFHNQYCFPRDSSIFKEVIFVQIG